MPPVIEGFPERPRPGSLLIVSPTTIWPVMALRGVWAILCGILALVWPALTVLALALLFGAWALLDGVSLLVNAFRHGRAHADWRDWVPSLLAGLLGIAAAVVTVLSPPSRCSCSPSWPPSCSSASARPRSFSRCGCES
ncbi:MAG: DUF308 domain-containing protein [Pseudonocardiales bacterium]|nr:DUF308 domain-containing protein [Pseudonocardiales bacterium]MBV9030677.1 DUF308 domain-containing protein [Pseudonocardiales bacterium]